MSFLHWLKQLYSLDTLDTRFTISATTPPRQVASGLQTHPIKPTSSSSVDQIAESSRNGASQRPPRTPPQPKPSKWSTPEFYFYYLVFLICIPLMFKNVIDVSKQSHPNYNKFAPLLSNGWIPGRKVDNSDGQYASFRDNVPYLAIVLVLHPILRRAYDAFWRSNTYTQVRPLTGSTSGLTHGLTSSAAADTRLEQRLSFDFYFALIFVVVLHGFSAFKVLLILYINYQIATKLPQQHVPIATWVFNIGILFANELSRGYPYAQIFGFFLPGKFTDESGRQKNIGTWLDQHGGLISRWEVLFNITVLRLISFNIDRYWAGKLRTGGSPIEKKQLDPTNLSERDRVASPAKPHDYSFRNYIAYALYSPLYLAGPILTFNDYIYQSRHSLPSITPSRTLLYGVRFLISLLTMEVLLHFTYAVAISKSKPDWNTYSPFQLSMLGYFNLQIIWLKLLLPWRFFRLWALLDGVDPPENMVRCMSNNYSALAFWRGWHRSYNRWIVRYIYVPLGGSLGGGPWGKARAVANYLAVFTFVALWHDINLRLLMWGWLITLFVLPEVLATLAFPAKKWKDKPETYRMLCGVGAVGNILMMMAANLVGFVVGLDGLKGLVQGIVGSFGGVVFLSVASGALFVGAQVMFEVREQELREGIRMKC